MCRKAWPINFRQHFSQFKSFIPSSHSLPQTQTPVCPEASPSDERLYWPSIAYFISRAKRLHMISALILPTLSSCGNLAELKRNPIRITFPVRTRSADLLWWFGPAWISNKWSNRCARRHGCWISLSNNPPQPSHYSPNWLNGGTMGRKIKSKGQKKKPGGNDKALGRVREKVASHLGTNLLFWMPMDFQSKLKYAPSMA